MRLLRAVLSTFQVQLVFRASNPVSYFQILLQPAIVGAIAMMLYRTGGSAGGRPVFAIVGGGLIGLWSVTLFNASFDIQLERWMGTFEEIVGTTTPLMMIVVGKVMSSLALGLVAFLVNLVLATAVFGLRLPDMSPGEFAISFAVTVFCFFCVSMVLAPLFAWTRSAGSLVNGLEVPAYLLCGFMFPVTRLADWVQPLSWVLAPTWGVRAMYAAAGQWAGPPDYRRWWLLAVGLGVSYLVLAAALFRIVEHKARVTGELSTV